MRKLLRLFKIALEGSEKDYTSGSINRAILLLSIPMILEMVMESLFAVVDVFFVARISVEAVATVGLTESVITLVYSIAIGLSMAATAMVARRVGEKNPEAASFAAVQSIWVGVALSLLIGLAGLVYAEDILRLMGGSDTLIERGVGYTRIMLASNVVIMLLFLLNGIFRGAGDASLAMRSLWIANGMNILLDPLFIFGWGPFPELGLEGAAVATTIGRSIGVGYQLWILLRGMSILRIRKEHLRIKWPIIRRILEVGSGGAGQYIIASASWIFLMRIISVFGSEVVAGYTIAIRLVIFTLLPSWGIANAAATLVGQNLGAGKPERAEASVWKTARYNMFFLLTVSILFFLGARPLIGFFSAEPEVLQAGILSLRIMCLGYVFYAYGMVLSQAFNGAGDTRTPTIINFFCFWLLEIPLGYTLAILADIGPAGVYIAVAISETVLALVVIWIFRKGTWKLTQI